MAGANAEPSMEDILSSIKRIIAEDSEAALSSPRVKRAVGLTPMVPSEAVEDQSSRIDDEDEPDVLELTDEVDDRPVPAPESATFRPAPALQPAAQRTSAPDLQPESEPVAAVRSTQPEPAAADGAKKPVLASTQTVQSSKASLAALSALVIKPEITGTDTLEGMVREMIRPMLAEWINSRLPDIVDRMVAEEIARITARG